MNIRDHAGSFTVYVYSDKVDQGASVKVYLAQAGYDAYFFQDEELLKERIRDTAPHVLVFPVASLKVGLAEFIEAVNGINPETRMVAIVDLAKFDVLSQYKDHGILQVVSDVVVNLETRVVFAVENICEHLYFQFQNEQIFDDLNQAKTLMSEMEAELQKQKLATETALTNQKVTQNLPVAERLNEYQSAESKEEILTRFMLHLHGVRAVYFKFLPSVRSFVATHSSFITLDQIQGVGAQLQLDEMKDLGSNFIRGLVPNSMVAMLSGAFNINPAKAHPLFVQNHLEGIWIVPSDMNEKDLHQFQEEFALMSMCYRNLGLEKRISQLEVQDPLTELFNRDYYFKKLDEEVQRAKRIQQPISVARLMVDDFFELESTVGEEARDSILKAVAEVITKGSRGHDVACRISQNEFGLILPHSGKKGAALRAERIRRAIEASSILENGIKVSVSLGVSEYPSLCSNAQTLDETAGKALHFVANKGGNKICLFKASETHHPDFDAPAE